MKNNGIVHIHGKEYMTVARRVELAHQDKVLDRLDTEVLSHNPIVIKATIHLKGKVFTGISAVNPENARMIERENPYEVAETSAVGRALGFAGYGLIESVALADEVVRANSSKVGEDTAQVNLKCEVCKQPAIEKKGVSKSGKTYHGIFCSTEDRTHTRWLWN